MTSPIKVLYSITCVYDDKNMVIVQASPYLQFNLNYSIFIQNFLSSHFADLRTGESRRA